MHILLVALLGDMCQMIYTFTYITSLDYGTDILLQFQVLMI